MDIAGLIILQPWYQIESIFRMSKWFALNETSKNETRSFAMNIIDKKIEEYKRNVKNDGGGGNNNVADDDGMDRKKLNNFIDECVRLSLEERCFSREDMVNESVTMLLGVGI